MSMLYVEICHRLYLTIVGSTLIGDGYIFTDVIKHTDNERVNIDLPKCALNVTVGLPHHGNGRIIANNILILRRDYFDVTC